MSDEPKPPAPPAPPPAAAPASPSNLSAVGRAKAEASAKEGSRAPTPAPVIEYAMPAQKSSWLPSPALIKNLGCLIKLCFGLTVLLLMGYFALVALNPKARQWALQGTKPGPGGAPPSGKGPTPFAFVNQVLAIPAQALGKTDDVVKANNARAGQVDALVAEEEAKAKGGKSGSNFAPVTDPFATPTAVGGASRPDKTTPAATDAGPKTVSSAALLALAEKNTAPDPNSQLPAPRSPLPSPRPQTPDPGPQTPDQIQLAGNITVARASPAGAPRASAAFFFWTVNLGVSGVTQSKPARMLLNNRLVYEGDVVNRSLGITFAQLDAANQLLVFRDQSGATVTRSY